ncbi:sulfate ABC transporter permease [Microbacterium mangrovi]|uniref:Sulfate ABC transporter permease n=1 Tax=Microbacterium mangrovi TaxID=1348253 RepID=A0A0B2A2X6_9MICO|nr:sulfate ABC transporter permease [Microbacterium mangrovi]
MASEITDGADVSSRFARSTTEAADELRTLAAGLDALQTDAADRPSVWRRIRQSVLPPIICVIALIAAWQLYIVIAQPRPDIVPAPADVAAALGAAWETAQLQQAVFTSLERGILGFLIAIVVGTPIGLLLAEVKPLRRAFGPLISGLQVLPSVAWVPAAILWFGLTDATAYFVVLMGATPSVINGLISGIDQVPPQLRRVGQVLGAKKLSMASLIVLPAALPGYVAGLKQGWAFSWRSLMAAEIITTGGTMGFGLGTMLDNSRQLSDIASVLATIIVILVIGILVELVIFAPLERRLLRGRGLLQGGSR